MDPFQILALEKKLNAKWRQTEDYKEWLRSKNNWVDTSVDFYFEELESTESEEAPVVYEAVQETEQEPLVCPVTGQTSSDTTVCPVGGDKRANVCPVGGDKLANVCPVTGSVKVENSEQGQCPFANGNPIQVDSDPTDGKCPYINEQKQQAVSCPVTGQKAADTSEGCPMNTAK